MSIIAGARPVVFDLTFYAAMHILS